MMSYKNPHLFNFTFRVTTCLENLEMSGNLTAVREMSGIFLKVREKILSGKRCLKLFIVRISTHFVTRSLRHPGDELHIVSPVYTHFVTLCTSSPG